MSRRVKRGKRGPKADAEMVATARDDELTAQMRATGKAVFAKIEKLVKAGKDVPITLLGAARLISEWHTDFLTVQGALGDEKPAAPGELRLVKPEKGT